jgi:hypothetical protein
VRLKGRRQQAERAAWADGGLVQLELCGLRFTASRVEAVELARQLVAAADELQTVGEVANER